MIKFVVIFTFALRFVVGNAWLLPAHGYANNGVRGYLMIAGAANEGGRGILGRPYRSEMHEFLNEVEHFVDNFDINSQTKGKKFYDRLKGIDRNGADMNNTSLPIFDELHQTIRYLKANPAINKNNINGFGLAMGNTGKYADITMTTGPPKFIELKSLIKGTTISVDDGLDVLSGLIRAPLKTRTQFYQQFKDGYLKSINNLN